MVSPDVCGAQAHGLGVYGALPGGGSDTAATCGPWPWALPPPFCAGRPVLHAKPAQWGMASSRPRGSGPQRSSRGQASLPQLALSEGPRGGYQPPSQPFKAAQTTIHVPEAPAFLYNQSASIAGETPRCWKQREQRFTGTSPISRPKSLLPLGKRRASASAGSSVEGAPRSRAQVCPHFQASSGQSVLLPPVED